MAPAAAIANAVADALHPLGVDAAAVNCYPLTAARVFRLLHGEKLEAGRAFDSLDEPR